MPADRAADRRRPGVRAPGRAAARTSTRCRSCTSTSIPLPGDYNQTLLTLLDSPNIASKAWVFRQYDYLVRSNTVVEPGSDAAVLRIKGTHKAIALSVDCNSRYCALDPYVGAMIAVVESARNVVCAGAEPLGITDCLNFGNPEKPEVMWQFAEAVRGIRDACMALGVPVVSGNVSFYNETDGRAIPPTPTIAMVGLLERRRPPHDAVVQGRRRRHRAARPHARRARRQRVPGACSTARCAARRRGSTSTSRSTCSASASTAIAEGLVRSAHDVAEGGLAVALAECCISGPGAGSRRGDRAGRRDPAGRAALRREPVAHHRLAAPAPPRPPAGAGGGGRRAAVACSARCAAGAW